MVKSTEPIDEKAQEKIAFQKRLAQCNSKPIVKTESQMKTIYFRVVVNKEVMPVLAMSS